MMTKSSVQALAVALAALMVGASGGALAHGNQGDGNQGRHMRDQGMGSGMMMGRDMGPGMSGQGMGHGRMGRGSGHGMMRGQGMMGQGMMGHGMMGHGMMGRGMGHGMMMGSGMGPYMAGVLGLSEQQRERLDTIERESAREHWQLMQEMQGHGRRMMALYGEETPEPEAVGEAWSRMADARRRMLEQQVRMRNRMREVLDAEQRERLDEMRGLGEGSQ